jgi:hypothetical protein
LRSDTVWLLKRNCQLPVAHAEIGRPLPTD